MTISIEQLYSRVELEQNVYSETMSSEDYVLITGEGPTTRLTLSGTEMSALSAYQIKAAGGGSYDVSGITGLINRIRSGGNRAEQAADRLKVMVSNLNRSLALRDPSSPLIKRVATDASGNRFVGGVVTQHYAVLTHLEVVSRLVEHPGFENAQVVKHTITPARLDFTLILDGQEWKVDGGLKSGINGGNGQFGDRSASMSAMLFRILCLNGMMDVNDKYGFSRRHFGEQLDLTKELDRVMIAADEMFGLSKKAMEIECDVVDLLTQSYRRGHITRGQFRKTLERRNEVLGGVEVTGATTTLWGASQAVTAAGRDYSLSGDKKMGEFAGRLIRAGDSFAKVIKCNAINTGTDDFEEILSEFGLAA